jgi:tRNA 2-thiouridine synthesizing protein A
LIANGDESPQRRVHDVKTLTEQAQSAIRSTMTTTKLDLRGLNCPLPTLKTRKALKRAASGDRLEITCTDPLAAIDIPNLIHSTGDLIEHTDNNGDTIVFVIRKRGKGP